MPSRFNARTVGDDGRLILWNTFTGAVSVFKPRDRDAGGRRAGARRACGRRWTAWASTWRRRGFLVRDDAGELDQFRYRFARQHWRQRRAAAHPAGQRGLQLPLRVLLREVQARHHASPRCARASARLVEQRAPRLTQLGISWFGGEPLYGWEAIEELAPFFIAHRRAPRPGVHPAHDHQRVPADGRAGHAAAGVGVQQLPGDGGRPGRRSTTASAWGATAAPPGRRIMDNLRSLSRRATRRSRWPIRVNFDRENVPRLAPFIEALSEDFGGDPRFVLRFRPVGRWGGANDERLDVCGRGEGARRWTGCGARRRGWSCGWRAGSATWRRMGAQVCYAARPVQLHRGRHGQADEVHRRAGRPGGERGGPAAPGRADGAEGRADGAVGGRRTSRPTRSAAAATCSPAARAPPARSRGWKAGSRTCSGVRSELKREMRFTLEQAGGGLRAVAMDPVAAGDDGDRPEDADGPPRRNPAADLVSARA